MSETTIIVAVDDEHARELEIAWPSWKANRPLILNDHLLLVCDGADGTWMDWSARLSFVDHPHATGIIWDGSHLRRQGADQREVMLTGLVHAAAKIKTTHFVKIDTDTVAVGPGKWVDPEWLDESLAFVSHRWGFTRPSRFISQLDEWAASVPELAAGKPPIDELPGDPDERVCHARIQSWWMLGTTKFARLVWSLVEKHGGRMPCPSQDTLLWYVAERMGLPYKRLNLKKEGWAHGRGALRRWANGVE